jgi:hypothetical protein
MGGRRLGGDDMVMIFLSRNRLGLLRRRRRNEGGDIRRRTKEYDVAGEIGVFYGLFWCEFVLWQSSGYWLDADIRVEIYVSSFVGAPDSVVVSMGDTFTPPTSLDLWATNAPDSDTMPILETTTRPEIFIEGSYIPCRHSESVD